MNFTSLTVFVLAYTETDLLRETVSAIKNNCDEKDLQKIIIVAKNSSCPSYFTAQDLTKCDNRVELYVQKAPTAQLCLAELPPLAESSHFVIMAADMEMNPDSLKTFISKAKQHPNRIICAAKWLPESTVIGYGRLHGLCTKTMNRFISFLFNQKVYDPFSIYQIYPTELYYKMNFNDPARFLYEYTLKPLSMGEEYEEIPTVYNKRATGKSSFSFLTLCSVAIRFMFTGIRIRFKF